MEDVDFQDASRKQVLLFLSKPNSKFDSKKQSKVERAIVKKVIKRETKKVLEHTIGRALAATRNSYLNQ